MASQSDFDSKFSHLNRSNSTNSSFVGIKKKIKMDDQRDIYVEKYGVDIQFPAFYYIDAKFVPNMSKGMNEEHIVVMAYHIIP